jgi:DNA-binding NarL/FixJ family response regulator
MVFDSHSLEPDGGRAHVRTTGKSDVTNARQTLALDTMARFLIIDDHPLFREALHSAVELAYPEVETVDAADFENAIEILRTEKNFDLVLLDLKIPGVQGFEGLLKIRSLFPRLPVVVISGHEDSKVISEALSYGAAGFIPKSVRKQELTNAIRQIMDGAVYVPQFYSPPEETVEDQGRKQTIGRLASLTPQQLRVLQMLREGLLNKQIAYELNVGETTIKAHVSEILRKLNVYSRTQAVIEVSKLDVPDLNIFTEGGPHGEP